MALLPILEFPDPRLRTVAKPVAKVDDSIQQLIDDMFETMYNASGIGLAATQVDHHQRLVVVDLSEDKSNPKVFINPELKILDPELGKCTEGCLSVPGLLEEVCRPQRIEVTALDRNGETFSEELEGLMAICLQHEIDHLNGKLFVDYLTPDKHPSTKVKAEETEETKETKEAEEAEEEHGQV